MIPEYGKNRHAKAISDVAPIVLRAFWRGSIFHVREHFTFFNKLLEANENAPDTNAFHPIEEMRDFFRNEIGILCVFFFFVIEFGIVSRFLHHERAASGSQINDFCITLFMPVLLLISVFISCRKIKRVLASMDADSKHIAETMSILQGLAMAAFLTMMLMVP